MKRNVFKRIWEAIVIDNDYDLIREINRRRGSVKSEAKTKSSRENGKKGGRPKKIQPSPLSGGIPAENNTVQTNEKGV